MTSFSALLSEDASMSARPLRSWNEITIQALIVKVHEVLDEWQSAFDLAPTTSDCACNIMCQSASDAAAEPEWPNLQWDVIPSTQNADGLWWALWKDKKDRDFVDGTRNSRAALMAALFGEVPSTPLVDSLADEVVEAAWTDWCRRIWLLFEPEKGAASRPTELFTDLLHPWSGAVVITLPWCGQTLGFLVSHACVSACMGLQHTVPPHTSGTSALVPFLHAAGSLIMPIYVDMEPIEIDLGTLASLCLGDILRTTHALETPLVVKDTAHCGIVDAAMPATPNLCRGFLGRQGRHRALELLKQT